MRQVILLRPALLLALASAACGSADSGGGWSGTTRDSAGITIVENPIEGQWSDVDRWRFAEELRIGVAEGDPDYQFGQIGDIAVDSSGQIYVLDRQAQHVRLFDAEGEYLRTIGAPGDGPGQLSQNVVAILIGPGDTLLVPDLGNQRVQRFLQDGSEASSFPVPFTGGITLNWQAGPDRSLVHQLRSMPMSGAESWGPSDDLVLVRRPDGTVRDTLLVLPAGESVRFTDGRPDIEFFAAEPAWALLPDGGLVSAITTDYRFKIHDAEGGLERVVTRPWEPKPITESDRDRLRDALRETMRQQGAPPNTIETFLGNAGFADRYPAFARFIGGPDGTVWVQRVITADKLPDRGLRDPQDFGSGEWDVFDRRGRYLGETSFPERFQPLEWKGDRVYGVFRDELDIQHVVRLQLVRPADTA